MILDKQVLMRYIDACELIEDFASGVALELRERGLTRCTDGYLEAHAWELMKNGDQK